jgi:hypothetical protein
MIIIFFSILSVVMVVTTILYTYFRKSYLQNEFDRFRSSGKSILGGYYYDYERYLDVKILNFNRNSWLLSLLSLIINVTEFILLKKEVFINENNQKFIIELKKINNFFIFLSIIFVILSFIDFNAMKRYVKKRYKLQ